MSSPAAPSRGRIVLAFAIVYLVWGSTYLGIRFAIESIPPFFMAAARFLIAGAILYAWSLRDGGAAPTRRQWWNATVVGFFLLTLGNGLVTWAELKVPSGLAALIVAAMPIWLVLLEAVRPGGTRPAALVVVGVAVGIVGQVVLVGPRTGGSAVNLVGVAALVIATMAWAAGSIRARLVDLPESRSRTTAMEMLGGGAGLLIFGLLHGETPALLAADITSHSLLALGYLTLFGSLLAFTAFVWLNTHVAPARVATYAYVNPVVAVFLGWLLAGEPVTTRTLIGAGIIVGAVIMINTAGARSAQRKVRAPMGARLRTDG
jgi:drug/metabolite transporter (DMT)-like permease